MGLILQKNKIKNSEIKKQQTSDGPKTFQTGKMNQS